MTSRFDICPICGMESCDIDTGSSPCVDGLREYGLQVMLPAMRKANVGLSQNDIEHIYNMLGGGAETVSDAVDWMKRLAFDYYTHCAWCGLQFVRGAGGQSIYCSEECRRETMSYQKRNGFRAPWLTKSSS